ncbi:anti-silencing protein a-like protein [Trypanosoma grayi]|uniref:anti-silencing protein a-like protein n=1 Tax=Trypanosoma grayi TaxID=71804 RepID=UPI0004F49CE6|nr:anti-silencing protein a-like protein [Trypanosoma grayi]KEG10752.1 anti-silencing protein a-like protein [Trypanosoma grayi]
MWKPIWDFPVEQDLDEFEVGPLTTLGKRELTLQSDPPDFAKIPDPTGPTALIISFSYKGREFLHLGYNAVVTCEGDIPDVFTDAAQLRRHLMQCFPKQLTIPWDDDGDDKNSFGIGDGAHEEDNGNAKHDGDDDDGNAVEGHTSDSGDEVPPLKKAKCD